MLSSLTWHPDFFIANYDFWKDFYEDITLMFRKATLSEYNLWQASFSPGNVTP